MNTPRTFTLTRVKNGWLIRLHHSGGQPAAPDDVYVAENLDDVKFTIEQLIEPDSFVPSPVPE